MMTTASQAIQSASIRTRALPAVAAFVLGLVLFYAAAEGEAEAVLKGDPAVGAGIFVGTVRPYAPPMVNTARLASERD